MINLIPQRNLSGVLKSMKLFKTILIMCIALLASRTMVNAQNNPDVTLTVLGTGVNKEEAVTNALRSAIEQAYGVFVSSDLTILNDEVVRNEIATISKGNIKSYKELSVSLLPNNNYSVTLSAVVSTSRLVSYAKSKGAAVVDFSGAVFGQRLKIMELNEKNEAIALENMKHQLDLLVPHMFYFELKDVKSPKIVDKDPVYSLAPFFEGLARDEDRIISKAYLRSLQKQMGCKYIYLPPAFENGGICEPRLGDGRTSNEFRSFCETTKFAQAKYIIPAKIEIQSNDSFEEYINIIFSTIRSLSLTKEEVNEYEEINKNVFHVEIDMGYLSDKEMEKYKDIDLYAYNRNEGVGKAHVCANFYLRTRNPFSEMMSKQYKEKIPIFDFRIYAKLGNLSIPIPYCFIHSLNSQFPFINNGSFSFTICIGDNPFVQEGRLGNSIGQIPVELFVGGHDIPIEQISSFEIKQEGHLKAEIKEQNNEQVIPEPKSVSETKKDTGKKRKFGERLFNALLSGVNVEAY